MKEFRADAASELLGLTRRGVMTGMVPAFLIYALLNEAGRTAALPRLGPRDWIDQQQDLAEALASGQIAPPAWCSEVEALSAKVDIADLLATTKLAAEAAPRPGGGNDPEKHVVRFTDESGRPRRLSYGAALFRFQPDNVITPHAHRNMVSAHLVVEGTVRIRTFDRVRDEKNGIVIRPAEDVVAGLGGVSTMCAERHNIHWFTPQGGAATTLDVIIDGLSSGGAPYEITALDPLGGKHFRDGSILAPIIGFDEATAKYRADL